MRKMSAAHRKKISDALKGRPGHKQSLKTRAKISKTLTGYKPTLEARKNMSAAQLGRKHTDETKRKISEANKGHKTPQEIRDKLSQLMKKKLQKKKEIEVAIEIIRLNQVAFEMGVSL